MLLSKKLTLGLAVLGIASLLIGGCGDKKPAEGDTGGSTPTKTVAKSDPYDPTVFPKRRTITTQPKYKFTFGDKEAKIYTIQKFDGKNIHPGQMYASAKHVYIVDTQRKKIQNLSIVNGKVNKTEEVGTVAFPPSAYYDANDKGFLWQSDKGKISWNNTRTTKENIKHPLSNNKFVLRKNSKATDEVWYAKVGDVHKVSLRNGTFSTPSIEISGDTLKKAFAMNIVPRIYAVDDKAAYFSYNKLIDGKSKPILGMTDLQGNLKFEFIGITSTSNRWVVTNNYVAQFDLPGKGIIYNKADGSKIADIKLPGGLGVTSVSFAEGNDIYIIDNKRTLQRIDL